MKKSEIDELRTRALSAYYHVRDYPEASRLFRELYSQGEATSDDLLSLAFCDAQHHEDQELPAKWIELARAAGADGAAVLGCQCGIEWSRGARKAALALAKEAARLNPSVETLWTLFTVLQDESPADAEFICREMIRRYPQRSEGFSCLGSHLLETDRAREAIDYLERAVEVNSENLNTLANLGDAYFAVGDYAKAGRAFEELVKYDFRDLQNSYYLIGMCYLKGDKDEAKAREYFQKALEIKPDFEEAEEALRSLGKGPTG